MGLVGFFFGSPRSSQLQLATILSELSYLCLHPLLVRSVYVMGWSAMTREHRTLVPQMRPASMKHYCHQLHQVVCVALDELARIGAATPGELGAAVGRAVARGGHRGNAWLNVNCGADLNLMHRHRQGRYSAIHTSSPRQRANIASMGVCYFGRAQQGEPRMASPRPRTHT